ncbi:hypothetical protein [Clostridium saudiense]|uniref:hypothetical protein n=1 Tax=Clostridium saudiense TaxID=1414720 RepID=UPI0029095BE6|nr:hypothetical protein [Clostridium saudiense]MDU7454814.1 hypothetical protein [Clostridium saudiense]
MKKIISKKLRVGTLLLCTVMMGSMFFGCRKEEKQTINFINYGENIGEGILDEFEEKYGIHVNQEVYDAPEEMYNKITYSL